MADSLFMVTLAAIQAEGPGVRLCFELQRVLPSVDSGPGTSVLAAAVGWAGKVIDRLAKDIQDAFPGITGFSQANIYRM